ncbi:MAG: hypothetical protein C4344_03020 [Acidimicrobiia bacterium]
MLENLLFLHRPRKPRAAVCRCARGGGRDLISPDSLPPGTVYRAAATDGGKVAIHRIEVSGFPGSGKLRITGSSGRAMRDSIQTAFDFVKSRAHELGIDSNLRSCDFHVQMVDLTAAKGGPKPGWRSSSPSTRPCAASRSRLAW